MALVFCNITVMVGIHLAHTSFDLGPLIVHPASRIPAGQSSLSLRFTYCKTPLSPNLRKMKSMIVENIKLVPRFPLASARQTTMPARVRYLMLVLSFHLSFLPLHCASTNLLAQRRRSASARHNRRSPAPCLPTYHLTNNFHPTLSLRSPLPKHAGNTNRSKHPLSLIRNLGTVKGRGMGELRC